jgi:hypothetical protein
MAVNLSPVFGVAGQLFDNNGNPLAGGKIFTYTAGTTTPAATFTSASGAIAHSNPIVLDGAGRVPSGEIWLTDGIQYKFVVEDAASNLIGTYDNLSGINSNFVAFTNEQEIQTATAGQTVFNLTTMQYQPGTNSLSVFVDGVNQYGPGALYAYVETDSDTVTFVSGLHVGASVKFTTSQLNSSGAVDAAQVSYDPPFPNSVTTNVEDKLAQTVSVKDFGAVGDGIADDTAAFRACYQYIVSVKESKQSTVFDYTEPIMYVPYGKYLITGSITQATGAANSATQLIVEGEDSILIGGAGSFNFFEFRTNCTLRSLSFQEGGRAFYIQSGNSDSARFNIQNCTFQNQTVECFGDDGASSSSIVNILNSKIYQVNGGTSYPRIGTFSVDQLNIENNWIYYGGTGSPFYTNCNNFNFVANLCVPNYLLASNTQRSWFYNSGTINLNGNRFGAEGGGCVVIEHDGDYSAGTIEISVTATNNKIYSSNNPAFKFFRLPSSIFINNNSGYDLTPGIVEWGSGITENAIAAGMARGLFIITDITTREFQFAGATPMFNALGSAQQAFLPMPAVSDLIISANTDLGASNRIASSSGAVFYSIGGGRTGRRFQGPTDTLLNFYVNPTGQAEIEAIVAEGEWFTVIYYVLVLSNTPMSGYVTIGSKKLPILVNPGTNILSYQLVRATGQTSTVTMTFGIKAADDIVVGPLRVFKGCYQQQEQQLKLSGSAAPISGRFFIGEQVIYDSPSASSFIGEVCVTSGSPGTWKTFGAISA